MSSVSVLKGGDAGHGDQPQVPSRNPVAARLPSCAVGSRSSCSPCCRFSSAGRPWRRIVGMKAVTNPASMPSTWVITSTSTRARPVPTRAMRRQTRAHRLGSTSIAATATAPVPACLHRWLARQRSLWPRIRSRATKVLCAPSRKARPNALSGGPSPDRRGGSLPFLKPVRARVRATDACVSGAARGPIRP